jgi:hypothetical protein
MVDLVGFIEDRKVEPCRTATNLGYILYLDPAIYIYACLIVVRAALGA